MKNQRPAGEREAGLRVGFVPGVTLTKWRRIWADRFRRIPLETVEILQADQLDALIGTDPTCDLCFVRLPIEVTELHLIRLYEEQPVVVVPKDHPLAEFEELTLADLDGEQLLSDPDSADAADRTAWAGGLWLTPQSVARAQSRRDLVAIPLADGEPTTIGLAWRRDDDNRLIEEFVGIVRGRTANSSRTQQARAGRSQDGPSPRPAKPKPSAEQKRPAPRQRPTRRRRAR